jgi:hypothetical protein
LDFESVRQRRKLRVLLEFAGRLNWLALALLGGKGDGTPLPNVRVRAGGLGLLLTLDLYRIGRKAAHYDPLHVFLLLEGRGLFFCLAQDTNLERRRLGLLWGSFPFKLPHILHHKGNTHAGWL